MVPFNLKVFEKLFAFASSTRKNYMSARLLMLPKFCNCWHTRQDSLVKILSGVAEAKLHLGNKKTLETKLGKLDGNLRGLERRL